MIGRWLVAIPSVPHYHYYAGKAGDRGVWVKRKNSATKFVSHAEAESFALLIAIEQPELLSKVVAIPYDECPPDPAPVVDGREAGR